MSGLKQKDLFKSRPPAKILLLELWPARTNCVICGTECGLEYGLAVYEDLIVPDDYRGEWGGAPACRRCFDLAAEIQKQRPGQFVSFSEVKREAESGKRNSKT
jgi:hypothetical protein